MSQVTAYLPAGFSNADKEKFKTGVKEIFVKVCGFRIDQSNVFIEEYRPEDVCENGAEKMALIIYTTAGKSDDEKNEIAFLYDKLCGDVFGDKKRGAFITFEEHTKNNICARGKLVSRMNR